MKVLRVWLVSMVSVAMLVPVARPDDASLGRVGESVQSIQHTAVEMVDEDVVVKMRQRSAVSRFHLPQQRPGDNGSYGIP